MKTDKKFVKYLNCGFQTKAMKIPVPENFFKGIVIIEPFPLPPTSSYKSKLVSAIPQNKNAEVSIIRKNKNT